MAQTAPLGAMPLYTHLDRIARGLAAKGIGPHDRIPPEQLFALDQWHYHGTAAIEAAATRLALGPQCRVLDDRPAISRIRGAAVSPHSSCSRSWMRLPRTSRGAAALATA